MVWMSDQTLLAKDERQEKMTLLISVPIKSPLGTSQKFPYQTDTNKGDSEYETQ